MKILSNVDSKRLHFVCVKCKSLITVKNIKVLDSDKNDDNFVCELNYKFTKCPVCDGQYTYKDICISVGKDIAKVVRLLMIKGYTVIENENGVYPHGKHRDLFNKVAHITVTDRCMESISSPSCEEYDKYILPKGFECVQNYHSIFGRTYSIYEESDYYLTIKNYNEWRTIHKSNINKFYEWAKKIPVISWSSDQLNLEITPPFDITIDAQARNTKIIMHPFDYKSIIG